MANCISIAKATTLSLGSLRQPVVTKYQLGKLIFDLLIEGNYQKQPLCTRKELPVQNDFSRVLKDLVDTGILTETSNFPSRSVFNILGKEPNSPGEVACIVDPFAYVSHLTAMEFHGLTDRFSKTLYLTSLGPTEWKHAADKKIKKDFSENLATYRESEFPRLQKIKLNRVFGTVVKIINTKSYLGAYTSVQDSMLRVSTIGRTFLDMLRNPEYCGGMRHVLQAYREYAPIYSKLILQEIDRHGGPIDKVRAGYILDEVCGLSDPIIQNFLQYAQRGGSRKLVSNSPYSPVFSEKWCLSINTEAV